MNKVQPLDLLNLSDIETLVFAGGGNRCWWQAGIIVQLLNWGWNLPGQLIGTSAGAGIAVSCLADGPASALQACLKLYSCNPRVFDWQSLVKMKIRFAH